MEPAVKRTWMFLVGITAAWSWLLVVLLREPGGPAGVARLFGVGTSHAAPLAGWVLAAVVATAFCGWTVHSFPFIGTHLFEWSGMKAFAIVFALVTGSMEEFWFRGMLMDLVQAHGHGPVAQVAFSALVFGIAHSVWGLGAGAFRMAAGAMVATTVLGTALSLVYLASGRSVVPCVWAHIVINLVLEPWLLVAAMRGMHHRRSPMASRP